MPRAVVGLAAGRRDDRDDARVVGFMDGLAVGVADFRSQNANAVFAVADDQALIVVSYGRITSAVATSGRAMSSSRVTEPDLDDVTAEDDDFVVSDGAFADGEELWRAAALMNRMAPPVSSARLPICHAARRIPPAIPMPSMTS